MTSQNIPSIRPLISPCNIESTALDPIMRTHTDVLLQYQLAIDGEELHDLATAKHEMACPVIHLCTLDLLVVIQLS